MNYNGRKYTTGRIFTSIKATNEFLEKNPEYGVVGERDFDTIFIDKQKKVFVAKCSDLGSLT